MNDEASGSMEYIYIHWQSEFKVLSAKVYIVKSCSCVCKSLEYFVYGIPFVFMSCKKAFRSYLLIFKCALAIIMAICTV